MYILYIILMKISRITSLFFDKITTLSQYVALNINDDTYIWIIFTTQMYQDDVT